jgi:hypothetical protein
MFGNAGRNNITGRPFKNFDVVFSRTINLNRIREGLPMQWRAELFIQSSELQRRPLKTSPKPECTRCRLK